MFYAFSFLSSPFLSFLFLLCFFLSNMAWPTKSYFSAWEMMPYATLAHLFLDITICFITETDYLFNKENKPLHHSGLFLDGSCWIYFCGHKINTVFTPDKDIGYKKKKKTKKNVQKYSWREQDGRGVGGRGVHFYPRIHQEYTFRHRSACRIPAENRQEYQTSGKEYMEPRKTR